MVSFILGISITLNVVFIVIGIIYFKIQSNVKNDFVSNFELNDMLKKL